LAKNGSHARDIQPSWHDYAEGGDMIHSDRFDGQRVRHDAHLSILHFPNSPHQQWYRSGQWGLQFECQAVR
jgi:hypothetical protein